MFTEFWSDVRYRVRAIVRRAEVERELDDELRFHLEREADKHASRGVSPEEAMRRARIALGGVGRIKDDARDARGVMMVEHLVQDLRFALRGLRTRPLFASVVVTTLALGVGVNAAMFGILDRLLFRPPSYLIDPASVNRLYAGWTESDGRRRLERGVAYTTYADLARSNRSLSAVAAFTYRSMPIGDREDTRDLVVGIVSAGFFDFFGANPVMGRFFGSREDRTPAGDAVAVLSFGFWQSHYAGRDNALGTKLRIGQSTYTIVGIAPRDFEGMSDGRHPAAFVPVTTYAASARPDYYTKYYWTWLDVLVRRKPGVTVDEANADLTNAYRGSWNNVVIELGRSSIGTAQPIVTAGPPQLARGPMAGSEAKVTTWIGGVAFVVLLIACANVANMLLARALRRRREMGVRRAIGATRARLVQQLLTEALVLAGLGTAAGLFGAQFAARLLGKTLIGDDTSWPVAGDPRTLAFAIVLALLITLLSGLLPALWTGRGDLAGSLTAGTREGAYRQSRARTTLLLVQTALSVVLLIGAGLFLRSLLEVRALPLGYDVDRIAYVEASMRGVKLDSAQSRALADRLLEESRGMPGVSSATIAVTAPFWSSVGYAIHVPGIDSIAKFGQFRMQAASPEYFATLGTRILRGRGLVAADRPSAPRVAVVSDAMAKALWKSDEPLGKCFYFGTSNAPCTTVVGVAENIKARDITGDGELAYYLPIAQSRAIVGPPPILALFVRVHGRPEDLSEPLRSRLQGAMPGQSYVTVRPLRGIVEPTMRSWASGTRMFLMFGALALLLAAIGLYSVIAFAVVQRTQELGVRIALGARARDVLTLVVGEGVRVTLGGVVIGAAIALVAGRWMSTLLFRVSPRDPVVFAVVALTLVVVGVLASVIPAARAARVDPNVALRTE